MAVPEFNGGTPVKTFDRASSVLAERAGEVERFAHDPAEVLEYDILAIVREDAVVREGVYKAQGKYPRIDWLKKHKSILGIVPKRMWKRYALR